MPDRTGAKAGQSKPRTGKRPDPQAEGEAKLVSMGMEEIVAAEHEAEGKRANPKPKR